ncbi:MAG: DUF4258 domain-containing protein [Sedimentisphaerales bacterium]|nr:DUF4258 domain-containing protein [Sedimentisphaerales bacterium]
MDDKILTFIRECIRHRRIRWTYHINMRLQGRFISREVILGSTHSYEIIEEYPDDKYLPSYLVYAEHAGEVFHIHIATDVAGNGVVIVTAYRPSPDRWEADLRTRRRP